MKSVTRFIIYCKFCSRYPDAFYYQELYEAQSDYVTWGRWQEKFEEEVCPQLIKFSFRFCSACMEWIITLFPWDSWYLGTDVNTHTLVSGHTPPGSCPVWTWCEFIVFAIKPEPSSRCSICVLYSYDLSNKSPSFLRCQAFLYSNVSSVFWMAWFVVHSAPFPLSPTSFYYCFHLYSLNTYRVKLGKAWLYWSQRKATLWFVHRR